MRIHPQWPLCGPTAGLRALALPIYLEGWPRPLQTLLRGGGSRFQEKEGARGEASRFLQTYTYQKFLSKYSDPSERAVSPVNEVLEELCLTPLTRLLYGPVEAIWSAVDEISQSTTRLALNNGLVPIISNNCLLHRSISKYLVRTSATSTGMAPARIHA